MNRFVPFAALATLSTCLPAFAAKEARCDRPFEASFQNNSDLHLDVRSGDIEIVGSDDAMVSVTCEVRDSGSLYDIKVRFESSATSGRLEVSGGPSNNVRLKIRVPRRSNLVVRCPAGDLDVIGVQGHKDVSLRAGDLTIDVGNPADYSLAEASVAAGDLHGTAFGIHKGGLFRSFKHRNKEGRYRLRASLWAGDITLRRSN